MKAVWAVLACVLGLSLGTADAACRQALALGLDVSGSVDAVEYRLQLDGLAQALSDAQVQEAFLQFPQAPVRLMVFEWSGLYHQRELIGWSEITGPAELNAIAATLRATGSVKINDPSTAVAAAMLFGADALARQECWHRTLDISGDGPANIGAHPGDISDQRLGQITVNALVIGPQNRSNTSKNLENVKSLESYFRSFIMRGPGAFAEVAVDHADFAQAMKRKLIKELDAPVLSRRGPAPSRG